MRKVYFASPINSSTTADIDMRRFFASFASFSLASSDSVSSIPLRFRLALGVEYQDEVLGLLVIGLGLQMLATLDGVCHSLGNQRRTVRKDSIEDSSDMSYPAALAPFGALTKASSTNSPTAPASRRP